MKTRNATYMMNNENLGPDNYSVFFCFYNWTDFAMEPDIEFKSDTDAVIRIDSIGFCRPKISTVLVRGLIIWG